MKIRQPNDPEYTGMYQGQSMIIRGIEGTPKIGEGWRKSVIYPYTEIVRQIYN